MVRSWISSLEQSHTRNGPPMENGKTSCLPALGRLRLAVPMCRLIAALMFLRVFAFALDPAAPINRFIRTDFTIENGLPSNVVNAIVQSRNGFLWVGTDAGLARFNGRRVISVDFRSPPPAPPGLVSA